MSLLFIRVSNSLKQNRFLTKGLVKNYLIFLVLFLSIFFILNYTLSVSANNSNRINITVSSDSWVESSGNNNNHGSDTILYVRNTSDANKKQIFLRFNLSETPPADITSATLNLYSMSSSSTFLVYLGVYSVENDSWGEYAITWNNKPLIGQLINTSTVGKNKWASWNVTDTVITEYKGDKILTLALSFSVNHTYYHKDFYSREYSDANYIPYLEVVYTLGTSTTTSTTTTIPITTTTTTVPTTVTSTTTTIETTTTTSTTSSTTTTTTTVPETTTTTTTPEETTTTSSTTTTTEPTTSTIITTTTIPSTTTTTLETTTTTTTIPTTTSTTTTIPNIPPTVLSGYVNYTGKTYPNGSITFWCDATDPDQDDSTLNVRLWIGTCNVSDCFTTRDWSDPPGLSNRQMTWDSGSGMFKYEWTIPWSTNTTIAGTCYAIDNQGAGSNWGDKYPFFTVSSPPPPTIPIVENSTTQNTTYCHNVTITVQAWDPDGIHTVILNDTIFYVMEHVSDNTYYVSYHPSPGEHKINFIVNDTKGYVNDTTTDYFYVYSAPSIVNVNITPVNPKTNDVLNCAPYGWYDADGDLPKYYYQWYDDSLPITNATNSTYSCSNPGCDKGDVIYCVVTPYDLYQNGTSVNGSVVIGNLPPSTPNLSPSTGIFRDIVYINCNGSTDLDGDTILYTIQTDVNGTWKDIVVNDSDGYYEWNISSYPCKNGVYLRCKAFDGVDNSTWINNNGINIDNCGPVVILVDPTPTNGVRLFNNWIFVNAIAVDNQSNIDACKLEWNGTNETMGKSTYDIIVDDGNPGFSTTGTWNTWTNSCGYLGNYHYETTNNPSDTARWTPNIPITGEYEVFVHYCVHSARPQVVPYTIVHSGGTTYKSLNQTVDINNKSVDFTPSGWKSLGVYNFSAGTSGYVELNTSSSGDTSADAVKFSIETCGLNKSTVDCGNYTYKVYANDSLGNEGSSGYRTNKENKKPSIPVLLSPSNATLTNKNVTFDWSDSVDDENDTITYDLLVDNDSDFTSPLIVETGLSNSTYKLNTTETELLTNGIYYWNVRAFDGYEYSSYSSFWVFTVDLVPPRVENSSITNVEFGENAIAYVDVWDENGVDKVILRSLNSSYNMNKLANNTYTVVIPTPPLGIHSVSYFANDTVGNVNDTVNDSFSVVIPPPAKVISVIISPSIMFNDSIYVGTGNIQFNVTFDKNMDNSTPLSVTYGNVTPYNNFTVIGNWISQKTWSGYSYINSSITNGNYTLNISGRDLVGNNVTNTSYWFIIDANLPRVISVILSPSVVVNNLTYVKAGNITFTITFNREMDNSTNAIVTFGRSLPYSTYVVNGSWFNTTTWIGYYNITPSIPNVWYTIIISGAKDLIGRIMTPDASHRFLVDTRPPRIWNILTSNITVQENVTISAIVKDEKTIGQESSGIDTVLAELNGSVNFTMNFGYQITYIGGADYVYYLIINNTSYASGNQTLKFYVSDIAGNVNSNATAFFYVNDTIPKIGGKIAFLCKSNPIGNMCNDDIEDELISWLRSQGWAVDVNTYNKWNKTVLSNYDLMVCSDERYACDYGTKSRTDVYYMHKINKTPFVEISDDSSLRTSYNFNYVVYPGGSVEGNINSLNVTISHIITSGYFGTTPIFNTNKTMTVISDIFLNGVKDIADAGNENSKSTLFSRDQPGRFVYIGWFYRDFSGLNTIGNTTLSRAISWAQCGNAKGCK